MTDDHPHKSSTGLTRLWRAWLYSLDGLRATWIAEPSFRQEVALAAVLIPVALLLPASAAEKALLVACVMLVLVIELVNSALEALVDRVSLEHHPLAKRAKDAGSAAVLVALCNLALVWLLVLVSLFG